eukprot:CAMPEP_0178456172 /NCGR_PEP_ID=MMETSP0689_2-20121128/46321_1 /TAXON_ID=160604 /ORGANISM="Amphidinium massartii, Strain CS-259" /LENGTH=170 /DNA_ID=CAMNT_0020082297 /DNA_START=1113 /DNA_END=1627 /DNA_ORIENTATION=+
MSRLATDTKLDMGMLAELRKAIFGTSPLLHLAVGDPPTSLVLVSTSAGTLDYWTSVPGQSLRFGSPPVSSLAVLTREDIQNPLNYKLGSAYDFKILDIFSKCIGPPAASSGRLRPGRCPWNTERLLVLGKDVLRYLGPVGAGSRHRLGRSHAASVEISTGLGAETGASAS